LIYKCDYYNSHTFGVSFKIPVINDYKYENHHLIFYLSVICQMEESNAEISPQNQDYFTIIGKTKGF